MPRKKYALKGEPDFHNLSDETVKSFLDLTQHMIFAYQGVDDSKVEVLRAIWKDLSDESTDRLLKSPDTGSVKTTSVPMRRVPKVRKSPAKR